MIENDGQFAALKSAISLSETNAGRFVARQILGAPVHRGSDSNSFGDGIGNLAFGGGSSVCMSGQWSFPTVAFDRVNQGFRIVKFYVARVIAEFL